MARKKSNLGPKARKTKQRADQRQRNFMDLTPSQDEPASQALPQDPEDSGAGVGQATGSPFNGFPSENGPQVNDGSLLDDSFTVPQFEIVSEERRQRASSGRKIEFLEFFSQKLLEFCKKT